MTQRQIAETVGIVAVAEIVLMFGIPAFWQAGVAMKSVVVSTILTSSWVAGIVSWMMAFAVLVILAISGVLLIYLGVLAILGLLKKITDALVDLAAKFDRLSQNMSEKARDAAIDAVFLAILGIASALVAFVSTEDFMARLAVLKVLAVASMSYALLKATMLIPIRSTQILSAALMVGILIGSLVLLHHKHPFFPLSQPRGVAQWFREAEPTQITSASAIIALSALSLSYPFTWGAWKRRILSIS